MNTHPGKWIRSFLPAVLGTTALLSTAVQAQTYPSKPIEFVVHTAPGGGTDLFARSISEFMAREKIFPQPFVVSNKPGGSGAIAFNYVKGKKGDGHVVLTMATGSFLAAMGRPELGLGLEHFTPVAGYALDPQVVAVATNSKYKTMKDLVEA